MSIRLLDAQWHSAIVRWRAGDSSAAAKLLQRGAPQPPFVRDWLAAVVSGEATRPRGRPRKLPSATLADAFLEWRVREHFEMRRGMRRLAGDGGDTPTILALEDTALAFSELSPDAVSRLVFQRRRGRPGKAR